MKLREAKNDSGCFVNQLRNLYHLEMIVFLIKLVRLMVCSHSNRDLILVDEVYNKNVIYH